MPKGGKKPVRVSPRKAARASQAVGHSSQPMEVVAETSHEEDDYGDGPLVDSSQPPSGQKSSGSAHGGGVSLTTDLGKVLWLNAVNR